MSRIKVGVVGCGNISDLYFDNLMNRYKNDIEMISCADIVIERAKEQAQKWGVPKAYTVDELMADPEVELVVNITIPVAHTEINQRAIKAGKHVYCEKPFAVTLEEAKETIEMAQKAGLYIGSAPDTFLGAGIQTCRKLIDEGWIGRPVSGTANFVWPGHELWHPSPAFYYKKGAGPILDMGPYYMAALVAMLGPVEELTAITSSAHQVRTIFSQPLRGTEVDVEVPTHCSAVLRFKNGCIVNVILSFDVWTSTLPDIEIYGTKGSMYCPNPDLFGGTVKVVRSENIIDSIIDLDLTNSGTTGNPFNFAPLVKEVPLRFNDPQKKIRGMGVVDMAHAIRDKRESRVGHEFALHVLEILTAFEKSSESGTVYKMTTTCDPKPLPNDLEVNTLD